MKNFFGILGGMGTMASQSFVELLNDRTPAIKDQDYFNYMLFNHATIPDRSAFLEGESTEDFRPDIKDDLEQLNLLKPDFVVLTCNTAHAAFDEFQATSDAEILNMPRLAVNKIVAEFPDVKRVGLIATPGTLKANIYQSELQSAGIEVEMGDEALQAESYDLIFNDIKGNNYVDRAKYFHILDRLFSEFSTPVVILGCTELSLAQSKEAYDHKGVIDAQDILVNKTVEYANKTQKKYGN